MFSSNYYQQVYDGLSDSVDLFNMALRYVRDEEPQIAQSVYAIVDIDGWRTLLWEVDTYINGTSQATTLQPLTYQIRQLVEAIEGAWRERYNLAPVPIDIITSGRKVKAAVLANKVIDQSSALGLSLQIIANNIIQRELAVMEVRNDNVQQIKSILERTTETNLGWIEYCISQKQQGGRYRATSDKFIFLSKGQRDLFDATIASSKATLLQLDAKLDYVYQILGLLPDLTIKSRIRNVMQFGTVSGGDGILGFAVRAITGAYSNAVPDSLDTLMQNSLNRF